MPTSARFPTNLLPYFPIHHTHHLILSDVEVYMAPDIATLFELRGLDFTAEERTRDRTVTRQLLSYRYSFTQDRTIYIPWWRKKEGQFMVGVRERNKVGRGRSTTPLTIFVLFDNVGPF